MRSRYRCSMCPAIHINSRSWLRSSSTHEPSDPPLRVVIFVFSDIAARSLARASPRRRSLASGRAAGSAQRFANRHRRDTEPPMRASVCDSSYRMVARVGSRRTLGRSQRRFIKPSRDELPSNDARRVVRDRYPPCAAYAGKIRSDRSPERVHQHRNTGARESDLRRPRRRAYRGEFHLAHRRRRLIKRENKPWATHVLSVTTLESAFSFVNDPSAGSPTETLLRLLLPLDDQV